MPPPYATGRRHALNYILFLRGLRGLLGAGFRGLVTHPLGELLRGAGAVGQAGQQLTKLGVGNSLEESIESKLMWEAIRKYLPKLELKECKVMIALYIDRLSVTATAAKLRVDASTVRRRRDSACDKIRKAMEEK